MFEWSDIDNVEEDKEILLNEFKQTIADPMYEKDLETGILQRPKNFK